MAWGRPGERSRVRLSLAGAVAAGVVALATSLAAHAGDLLPGEACCPSVSANGRYVAFATTADLGGPAQDTVNVYRYDRRTQRTLLVSRRSKGQGGTGGDDFSIDPSISASGRFVVYETEADNLGGPAQDVVNVYRYDVRRKRTRLVSRRSKGQGGGGGDGNSRDASISASGRFVAYQTEADNLGGPAQANVDVYRYDVRRKRTALVSRRSKAQGGGGADGSSNEPSISASGRFIAYDTDADNLGGPAQDVENVYRYDLERKRTALVSRRSKAQGGGGGDDLSGGASISASGRFIAYHTVAGNLAGPAQAASNVYRYDFERKRTALVSRRSNGGAGGDGPSHEPSISASGRFVAYDTDADNLGGPAQDVENVYRYDFERKKTKLISRRSKTQGGAGGDDDSRRPAVSATGRYIAYETLADNLGGPTLAIRNVYLYDLDRKRTRLASRP